jgi:hypothetical protein
MDAGGRALTVVLVVVGLLIAAYIIVTPLLNVSRGGRKTWSFSNMKQQAAAHAMYVEANDGFGPSPDTWMDQLGPYLAQRFPSRDESQRDAVFFVPFAERKEGEHGYAYYRPLGGVRVSDVKNPEEVVLAFESSDLRRNANGGFELLPKKPYWDDGDIVFSFLDTHVRAFKAAPKFEIELPE